MIILFDFSFFLFYFQRKDTLLQEYNQRFKTSKFVDKRIGENDANLSYEEKMTKRLVLEKQVRRIFCLFTSFHHEYTMKTKIFLSEVKIYFTK